MDLRTAIRSTGAVRSFTSQAIDDETLYSLLDDARFAPSGGNRQGWRVVVVKDPEQRRALAAVMRPVWDEYAAIASTGRTPFTAVAPATDDLATVPLGSVPNALLDNIAAIPAVLVVAADLTRIAMMDKDLVRAPLTGGGSIYPFCWNLLLAARSRGLGGVMTTFLSRAEPQAAPILRLPTNHAVACTVFLGHPVHQPTKLSRDPVEDFTTVDHFDGQRFDG